MRLKSFLYPTGLFNSTIFLFKTSKTYFRSIISKFQQSVARLLKFSFSTGQFSQKRCCHYKADKDFARICVIMTNFQTDKSTLSESTLDYRFKVVMLGDLGAGKTSLIQRYINKTFKDAQQSTLGVDFFSRKVSCKPINLRLQLWDTAGQQRYRCLVPSYLRNAHCVVLVFDITVQQSLDNLRSWVDLAQQHIPKNAIMAMAGTKSDLVDKTAVSIERITKIAKDLDAPFALVSAKTGEGVEELFKLIVDRLRKAQELVPDVETSSISDVKSRKQLVDNDQHWQNQYLKVRKANSNKRDCCYI